MKFWTILLATLVADVIGMTFARKFALSHDRVFAVLAVLSFAIVGICMIQLLQLRGIALANALWAGASAFATLLIGVFYFREQISAPQVFGIFAILIGIFLIEFFSKN